MMNLLGDREAKVRYFTSDYEVLTAGNYVSCAITGEHIPLAKLKYWCHIRQEAFKDAATATQAYQDRKSKG